MAKWVKEELSGGVVNRRSADRLAPGELVSASGVRLEPGDSTRLRRGKGWVEHRDMLRSGTVIATQWLAFEQRELLGVVMSDSLVLRLVLFSADMTEKTEWEWPTTETPVRAQFIHRGNEWFLISDQKLVGLQAPADSVSWPTPYEVGMNPSRVSPLFKRPYKNGLGDGVDILTADPQTMANSIYGTSILDSDRLMPALYPDWSSLKPEQQEALKQTIRNAQQDLAEQRLQGLELRCDLPSVLVYWVTEYDENRDVESAAGRRRYVVWATPSAFYWRVTVKHTPSNQFYTVDLPLTPVQRDRLNVLVYFSNNQIENSNATHWRIYRANTGYGDPLIYRLGVGGFFGQVQPEVGEDRNGVAIAEQYASGDTALVGGLLAQVEIDTDTATTEYEDEYEKSGVIDPPISYPLLVQSTGGITKLDPYLVKPNPAQAGAFFNDSLVLADATEPQVLYYSPPGAIEVQPRTGYREILATPRADRIDALVPLNDMLLLLRKQGIERINYLPILGTSFREQMRETVLQRHGLAGRLAWADAQVGNTEIVAWFSVDGRLLGTNGEQWVDLADWWGVDTADYDMEGAVLVNDAKNYVLRLMLPPSDPDEPGCQLWDFYYHQSLLEEGQLTKVLGPTQLPWRVQAAATDGEGTVWMLVDAGEGAYPVEYGTGLYQGSSVINMRKMIGPVPAVGMNIRAVAVQYETSSSGPPLSVQATAIGVNSDGSLVRGEPATIADLDSTRNYGRAFTVGTRGDQIQWSLIINGGTATQDWAIGPFWMDLDMEQSGDA